jgi:hypothetical protein
MISTGKRQFFQRGPPPTLFFRREEKIVSTEPYNNTGTAPRLTKTRINAIKLISFRGRNIVRTQNNILKKLRVKYTNLIVPRGCVIIGKKKAVVFNFEIPITVWWGGKRHPSAKCVTAYLI